MDKPYRALGVFQRVVPVIEELKAQLDHSIELSAEAQKAINKIKRNPESLYRDAEEPQRTWNAISRGVVSLQGKGVDLEAENLRRKQKFGPDGKRKTGYQINPTAPTIDLREVAEADSNNLMKRMSNLEKQFFKIPSQ